MGMPTKRELIAKESLYEIGYEYLRNNFHKFSLPNKIKVSLAILQIFNKDDSKTQSNIQLVQVYLPTLNGQSDTASSEASSGATGEVSSSDES